jgi:hypothetical protein
VKGQRKIIIVPEEGGGEPREYSLLRGVHVSACGPRERECASERAEIQEVYRLQGVNIVDKHDIV